MQRYSQVIIIVHFDDSNYTHIYDVNFLFRNETNSAL
jgi:hypothetical protein